MKVCEGKERWDILPLYPHQILQAFNSWWFRTGKKNWEKFLQSNLSLHRKQGSGSQKNKTENWREDERERHGEREREWGRERVNSEKWCPTIGIETRQLASEIDADLKSLANAEITGFAERKFLVPLLKLNQPKFAAVPKQFSLALCQLSPYSSKPSEEK